jgi:hypothetical protein
LAFVALKLSGGKRWSHDSRWNMDRALGFFASPWIFITIIKVTLLRHLIEQEI